MDLIHSLAQMQARPYPASAKVGFVPTMGFLHEGHLSLVDQSCKACDITVVSIFVNPAQFGPSEDLDSYPRDLDRDLALLKERGVDAVFFPSPETMYPEGYRTWVEVEGLSDLLCGGSRPGHFRGVCTVVLKLINIVRPHGIYMGEKDFQQLAILKTMARDLNLPVDIIGCPIIREEDGLAKSSRNVYLDPAQRKSATCLYRALQTAQQMVSEGITESFRIIEAATQILISAKVEPDYIQIVDDCDLSQVQRVDERSRMLIAAFVGKTRLIDNGLLRA